MGHSARTNKPTKSSSQHGKCELPGIICVSLSRSALAIHRFGLAHQSSLRSSTTMISVFGEAGSLTAAARMLGTSVNMRTNHVLQVMLPKDRLAGSGGSLIPRQGSQSTLARRSKRRRANHLHAPRHPLANRSNGIKRRNKPSPGCRLPSDGRRRRSRSF